ncbi:hypothetical protein C0Q70_08534 [Pomacea canaliculata]|uniref:Tyrosine specific protein phosphatases domain-containing protein n=1 Tax=Pomacea canaliculata TaxID=400727 RepID=A0A2T7PI34_POMCA|nr:hypothetical protein C0Q70_08534 [Pomacea canaliculata]
MAQQDKVANLSITVPNFRVLCGSSESEQRGVQDGVIYRSSRPDFLTEQELLAFRNLSIRSIIDFRSRKEYMASSSEGNHVLDKEYDLLQVKLPRDYIFNTGYKYFVRLFARTTLNRTGLIGQYKDIVEHSQKSICAALKLLSAKNNLPALINCAHGKDRTGIVSALVLSCLGKTAEYIAEEYALSSEGLAPVQSRVKAEVIERYHMCEEFIKADASTMLELFEYIQNRYGSTKNYLEYIGFGAREQEVLRLNLKEVEDGEKDDDDDFSEN